MELRYCEECGNPIRVELGQPLSITDHVACEACRSGNSTPRQGSDGAPTKEQLNDILESTNMNLFSPQTIVIHKQKLEKVEAGEKPKSSRLKLVKPGSSVVARNNTQGATPQRADRAPSTVVTSPHGGASPAKSAQKIVFRCMHCKATLSIRPVDKTSKLTCPHCAKEIFITISGRVLRMSPSVALKQQPATQSPAEPAAPITHAQAKPKSIRVGSPGSARVPLVPDAQAQARKDAGAPSSAAPLHAGGAAVIQQGSVRRVKPASSRVLKTSGPKPEAPHVEHHDPARIVGTDRGLVSRSSAAKPPSVRIPSTPASAPKPLSFRSPGAPGKNPSVRIESARIGTEKIPLSESAAGEPSRVSPSSPRLLTERPPQSTSAKPPSVRLPVQTATAPGAKPFSAFEEHQARQDPEKTVFITEEPTSDLSALAGAEALRSPRIEPKAVAAKTPKIARPEALLPDASDLLESESSAEKTEQTPSTQGATDPAAGANAPKEGIAQRVLKALFTV